MIFKFGELFCGPGGLALGVLRARAKNKDGKIYKAEHSFAIDNDPWACETYARNICKGNNEHVYAKQVEGLKIKSLPDIHALAFGFPCNDFSIVGEHKGIHGSYGGLYKYGRDILEVKKPKWFIAENVGGLRTANGGKTFKLILNDLARAGNGYNLTAHLYRFEEYGVPQKRHRIIIVGISQKEGHIFKVPAPTTTNRYKTAKEAIESPPIPRNAHNNEFTKQSKTVIERLSYIPEGKNAWCEELPLRLRLNVPRARLSHIYKRLTASEPAYTLTGSGGGGTHMYHWKEHRALTNRERARIQTFPDNFVFCGSKEQVRKQIGMAVPPHGAQIIAQAILKTFAGIKYKSVETHWKDALTHKET